MRMNLHIDWETVNRARKVTEMQSPENWAEAFTKTIGHAIDQARHGKSDQWIANQTKELGQPISRTAISEYRRGVRKNVPVTDLIVIARVLRVPPIYLLFPNLPEGPSFPFPGQPDTAAIDGMRWFTGESEWATPLPYYSTDEAMPLSVERAGHSFGAAEYNTLGDFSSRERMTSDEANLVWLSRSLVSAFRMRYDAIGPGDPETMTSPVNAEMWRKALELIEDLRKRIEDLGGTVTRDTDGQNRG